MSKRLRYEDVKKYCIPNLRAIDDDGNVHPVITTIQAQYEWNIEYRRAEFYRKCCIAEVIIIGLLSIAVLLRGE
ncbi:hypothetical protein [Butyrivibrio sp. XPD2006]|uniref:hypothetical protein n=1 Tax=Butyrivibrio sp. XPD2006 TaxID=1280668 RepID=UPI0003B5DC01|nr:hypothetical protein [Butyrivibrio sp. XPD2006]